MSSVQKRENQVIVFFYQDHAPNAHLLRLNVMWFMDVALVLMVSAVVVVVAQVHHLDNLLNVNSGQRTQ